MSFILISRCPAYSELFRSVLLSAESISVSAMSCPQQSQTFAESDSAVLDIRNFHLNSIIATKSKPNTQDYPRPLLVRYVCTEQKAIFKIFFFALKESYRTFSNFIVIN